MPPSHPLPPLPPCTPFAAVPTKLLPCATRAPHNWGACPFLHPGEVGPRAQAQAPHGGTCARTRARMLSPCHEGVPGSGSRTPAPAAPPAPSAPLTAVRTSVPRAQARPREQRPHGPETPQSDAGAAAPPPHGPTADAHAPRAAPAPGGAAPAGLRRAGDNAAAPEGGSGGPPGV